MIQVKNINTLFVKPTGFVYKIDGDQYELDNAPIGATQWRPVAWYYNRKTYFVIPKLNNSTHESSPVAGAYDPENNSVQLNEIGVKTGSDNYHNVPTCIIGKDNYFYVFGSRHNSSVQVFKSSEPESVLSFSLIQTFSGSLSYPNIYKVNDDLYVIVRVTESSVKYHTEVWKSTGAGDFARLGRVAECEPEGDSNNIRLYHIRPENSQVNGWSYLGIEKRFNEENYRYKFFLKTQDFITWHNYQESFSKNIVLSGALTDAELKQYFMFYDHGTYSDNPDFNAANYTINTKAEPIIYVRSSPVRRYVYKNGWQFNEVPVDLFRLQASKSGKVAGLFVDDGNVFLKYANPPGLLKIISEVAKEYTDWPIANRIAWPSNWSDIPKNQPFAALVQAQKPGTEATSAVPGVTSNDVLICGFVKL